jgi:RHS repeat-associated protein
VGAVRSALTWLAIRPRRRDRSACPQSVRGVVALTASQAALLTVSQAVVLAVGPSGMAVPELAAAESFCTDRWEASEGTWQTAADWSEGRVPGSSDVACIGSGKAVRVIEGVNHAGVVQGGGTLELANGSLEVSNALEVSSLHALSLSGGILTGAGTVDVSGSLAWEGSGGGMAGSGSTVIAVGATASLGDVDIEGSRVVVNEGTATLGLGTFTMSETAVFDNVGTFKANAESTPPVFRVQSGTPKIVNTGLFEKTAGSGRTEIGIPFESEGTIDGASGELRFFSGTEVALGGSVLEGSIENFATTIAGDLKASKATLMLGGGSFSVLGGSTATVGNLESLFASGVLTGAGTVDVSGSLTSNDGVMKGSGSTVILPGATATLGNTYLEEARSLVNEGVVMFGEGNITMSGTAEIKNFATFKANAESTSPVIGIGAGGGTPRIVNNGVFEKTEGTGKTEVEPDFENLGSIKEETGKLHFLNPVKAEPGSQYGGSENPSAPGQMPLPECVDPVDCATGNFSEKQTDLAVGGRGVGLVWTRYYNSQAAAAANTKGMFGYGWSSSFSDHLVFEKASTEKPVAKAVLYQTDGSTVPFSESGGKYAAPEWSEDTMGGSSAGGFTLRLANQTMYKFNGSGRLESVIDRDGNETTLTYSGAGRLEKITDPAGRKITLAYNSEGLVESAKDPMGHTVKYTYESGELASVTDPGESSARWQFKYNGSHEITTMTDGRGGKTVNEYNGSNQVTSQEDPAGHITTFEYESFQTKITNKATGDVIDEQFDSNGLPFAVTRGYGTSSATTETFTYNSMNEPLTVTDGNGHTTEYTYDSTGDRTSIIDPDKDETKWTYDGTHDVLTVETPKGEITTIKRNSGNGSAETIERPAPGGKTQITKYKYGSHGEVEKVTDALEHTWTYGYDSYGDRTAETTPETEKRTFGYNEDSQEVWTVSPRGNSSGGLTRYMSSIERDEQGRPLKVTDPLGHTTKYTYDGDGNVETITDGDGHKTTYTYNADNQPIKVKEPSGTVTETEYDGEGRVVKQIDGNKHATEYIRSAVGEVTEVIDPLKRKTKKEYDAAGNLTKLTDPEGRTTTYTYDPDNRLEEIAYSDGKTHSIKYEYDADGDRTSMVDGTGTTTYTYDQLDRLTESEDGHGDKIEYEYNLDNEQTKITYPNGKAVTRAYDNDGRLQSVMDWSARTTKFTYDPDSDLTVTTYPETKGEAKTEDAYSYNEADQMTQVKMTKGTLSLAQINYARDNDGQVKANTEKGLPNEEAHTYTYDENNRLVKAGGGHEWEYDDANNPTKIGTRSYAYNAADELETRNSYIYNEEGELTKTTPTKAPATTYGYDQAGNLISVSRPEEGGTKGISDTYTYDGNGLRASQTNGEGTKYMAWDMAEETPQVLYDGQNSYIYGPDGLPIEQINSEGKALYLHHDQQGSARLLTGSTGIVEGAMTYDPYGNLLASSGTKTTPLGYDGQYTNSDTGLIYLRAREYNPATDQFLSVDPLAAITRAPYDYTQDNPLNSTDPTGKATLGTCLHIGGLVGEVVGYQGQACVVVSSSGDIGGTASGGPTIGGGTGAVDVGPSIQISNATNNSELYGPFNEAGGSAAFAVGGFGDAFTGQDSCGEQISGGDLGVAVGVGAEAHVGPTYTVGASVNVPSLLQEFYEFPANAINEIDSGF